MTRRRTTLWALGIVVLAGASAGWIALKEASTAQDMTAKAQAFLATLSGQDLERATMPFADKRRVQWHFIPKKERKGLQLHDMNEKQRKAARILLRAALSEVGYDKSAEIMELEQILYSQQGNTHKPWTRDPLRYYWTVFGKPTRDGKWGLSIEGHHVSLNFVITDGKVASHTPAFFGSNPAVVKRAYGVGPKKGTRTLAGEELLGFDLLGSLSKDQRRQAIIADKAPKEIRAAGEAQPPQSAAVGLPAAKMTDAQKKTLMKLVSTYVHNMPQPEAAAQMAQIEDAGIDRIHFAWAGAMKEGVGHYYRVQGPTFLIELVNTQPDGDGNPANHVHCVLRSMKGDFGFEL